MTIFLSGCAGMSSKFDCDVSSGGKCAPMHHINQMASHGAFADKPEVRQIWIAPYEDSSGNYHEATSVYSTIKNRRSV